MRGEEGEGTDVLGLSTVDDVVLHPAFAANGDPDAGGLLAPDFELDFVGVVNEDVLMAVALGP